MPVDNGANSDKTDLRRCSGCNKLVSETAGYCYNCGRVLSVQEGESTAIDSKVNVVTEPLITNSQPNKIVACLFCAGCGRELLPSASICPTCGTSVGTPKDKSIAVLLAVFLGCWTWVYTYKRDVTKFWIGLAIEVFGFFTLWFGIGFLLLFGAWIWAI